MWRTPQEWGKLIYAYVSHMSDLFTIYYELTNSVRLKKQRFMIELNLLLLVTITSLSLTFEMLESETLSSYLNGVIFKINSGSCHAKLDLSKMYLKVKIQSL